MSSSKLRFAAFLIIAMLGAFPVRAQVISAQESLRMLGVTDEEKLKKVQGTVDLSKRKPLFTDSLLKSKPPRNSFGVFGYIYGQDDSSIEPYPLEGALMEVWVLGDTALHKSSKSGKYNGIVSVNISSNKKKIDDLRMRVRLSYPGMEPIDTIVAPELKKLNKTRRYYVNLERCVLHGNSGKKAEPVAMLLQRDLFSRKPDNVL